MRIDSTYPKVHFAYTDAAGQSKTVKTLEEEAYPHFYNKTIGEGDGKLPQVESRELDFPVVLETVVASVTPAINKEQHLTFQENQRGISYDSLFGSYLSGASRIVLTDPYIRIFYQVRNLMEFLETVVKHKPMEEEVAVHVITTEDDFKGDQQKEYFEKIEESCSGAGIAFTWEFDGTGTIHARHIETDNGWKILLDRGLDIFQHYEMNDTFTFNNRLQQFRPCKTFEVTFIKNR